LKHRKIETCELKEGIHYTEQCQNDLDNLPRGASIIVDHILNNFDQYYILTPLQARRKIAEQLIELEGWEWDEVWRNIKSLRQILNY